MIECPICDSSNTTHRFDVVGAKVSHCAPCSHSFSHDLQVAAEEIYNPDYFQQHHQNWFNHPNFPLFHKIEKMCLDKNISILDVGCGNGDLLRYLERRGFTHLTGVDFVQNEHPKIRFVQADLFQLNKETFKQGFDLIVTLATIEHVADVRKFVSILKSLANPGGLICIMTLDENSLIYKLSRWVKKIGIRNGINRLYDKHHLNHFSKKSLRVLLTQTNELEVVQHHGINFPLKAIDLPKSSLNIFFKPLVSFIFLLTSLLTRMQFLQVIVARKKDLFNIQN